MSGHTKGPWFTCNQASFSEVCVVYGTDLPQGFLYIRAKNDVEVNSKEERTANARLIAAAPDLLEALRAVDVLFGHLAKDSTQKTWLDKARAAIAKATGETT